MLLRNGTTTAAYFATIHLEATKLLFDLCVKYGQRALVGKVNMDRHSPDDYIESSEQSFLDTKAFIEYCGDNELVRPILTPRFVPTCTPELMNKLGELAKQYDLHIQSHISENLDEVAWVKSLHPDCSSYTDVCFIFYYLIINLLISIRFTTDMVY